ncbi:MAG: tetratricopeptide repeat protein [Victivallales bacterium]|nr:tetratricopeptide repeat protein [Victivallales bacterium]
MKNKAIKFWLFLTLAPGLALLPGCGRSQPLSTQELMNAALAEASRGEWQQALNRLDIVCNREPHNAAALVFRALAYEGCGKSDLALNSARAAVAAAPTDFQAQYTLGRICAGDKEKMQDAITPLLRALQLKPGDSSTLLLLGRCSSTLKLDSTIGYYRQLAAKPEFRQSADLWNEMAIYYAERKESRQAAECFVKAYKLDPSNPLITLNLATFVDQYFGDSERALKFYRRYLKLAVPSPRSEERRRRTQERIKQISGNNK